MPTTFRPYQPDQRLLLPPDLRDWLPEGHLAHPVSDLVDGLDLSVFYACYEGDGRRKSPYEPRMMVKVLIYGYATGVFSSRRLARKLEEDVALRVLASGNFPSHRTICEFRRRHLSDFKSLFVEVVRLAAETGVVNFGKLSIDGTKVRASASKRNPEEVSVREANNFRYDPSAFSDFAELEVPSPAPSISVPSNGPLDLCALRVSPRIKYLIQHGDSIGQYPSRSEALFAVLLALLASGYDAPTSPAFACWRATVSPPCPERKAAPGWRKS